jgi:A/G-specific adenine glycosylase
MSKTPAPNAPTPADFQHDLLGWFDQHGRKDLPWQHPITPYRVWLSETMLQQTQVATVIPYFKAFIENFPTLESLANAPIDEVLRLWAGLGYYARARNLHKAAQCISERGGFPDTLDGLTALPGIGPSTAGAILSIAFNKSTPILDGNVKRVLARAYAISGWPGNSPANKTLWAISAQLTPVARVADYTQAIMDLGATLCTRRKPLCGTCPISSYCQAYIIGTVADYPNPKPPKTLPVKQRVFLVLRNQNRQLWLEKRPPVGLWGGLWSLPEFDSCAEAQDWCLTHALRIRKSYSLPPQRHTFSHYHLDYTPLVIDIENPTNNVMEARPALWYNAARISDLGLAAPIKLLLQHLNKENDHDEINTLCEIR